MPHDGTTPRSVPIALVFVLLFLAIFVLHIPLIPLPYFWDEAGYYIPAARDLFLTGSLIPHSTVSNAHPPLVMAYLAACWKMLGYAPVLTRTAVLVVSAFALAGVFRLATRVANFEVAVAATICTGIHPVFFSQSTMAQVDLAAAALTFWALAAYVSGEAIETAMWFSLAVLAKETAIIAPAALFAWELLCPLVSRRSTRKLCAFPFGTRSLALLVPVVPLATWYAYHYSRTGFIFGNPEFFRYNVQGTLTPLRVLLAFGLRLWHVFGYLGMSVLTLAALIAMTKRPISIAGVERPRIAIGIQSAFAAVVAGYVILLSIIGGAPLVRYLLPVIPLVIIIFVSTLWRRIQLWWAVVAVVILGFTISLFVNPGYGFSLEDNLAYRDYIVLHQRAEQFLEARYPTARVLTAWPATDEIAHPYLGYITRPMKVIQIEDFTVEQLMSAADMRSNFDVALVFSTKYDPAQSLFLRWRLWQEWKARYFGYHRDVTPAAAAQLLGGNLIYEEARKGQWIGVIELARIFEARQQTVTPSDDRSAFSLRSKPAGRR